MANVFQQAHDQWDGQIEAACRTVERAQELFPNSPNINWTLGNLYMRAGKTHEGLRALQKVVIEDPEMRRQLSNSLGGPLVTTS